jgi:hypothetical protein
MKELKIELKNKDIVHSEYIYQYDKEEEKKEYLEKISDYAKRIEHETFIEYDKNIDYIDEKSGDDKQKGISKIKSIDVKSIKSVAEIQQLFKRIIEVL